MGEFDDVLAMEPGDEWDDYDGGDHAPPTAELPPSVAELRLRSATVHLRGEVPDTVLALLGPLTVPPASVAPDPVSVSFSIRPEGDGHRVVDDDRGEISAVGSDRELAEAVVAQLLEVAGRADPRQVHLPAAAVELADGRGALVVADDEAGRHELVAALVADGARYLGADRVALQPGSRTVLAVPTPLRHTDAVLDAASVATTATISLVVIVGSGDGGDAPERLGRPHGCARLLVDAMAGAGDGQELVRSVARLVAAAAVWEVPPASAPQLASTIAGLDGPATHELVVLRRPLRAEPDTLAVRFRHGGVLCDLTQSIAFEVAEEELPTIDALRWPVVARDPAADVAVLRQLSAAGIDLAPAVSAGVVRAPGPDSYGLPDAPIGQACAALWDVAAVERALTADERLAPALAHALRRAELVLDDPTAERLRTLADQVAGRTTRVRAALARVAGLLDDAGVEPMVIGPVVLADDGPLPAELVALDRIELMLASDELAACTDELVGQGATPEVVDPAEAAAAGPVRLVLDDGVPVVLRDRLAAGPFGELVDHDELLDRSVLFRSEGRWLHALHPDDRFVWACVQLAELASPTPSDLREVVLDAPCSREGMAAVLEASARWGATRTVLWAIRAVEVTLPGLSPWLVDRATRPSPPSDRRRRRGSRRI